MDHFHQQTMQKAGANKMVGMIESIFGKTTSQLAEERKIRDRQLTEQFAKLAEQRNANPAGAAIGASFGTSFARGLLGGIGLDPEMEKARQAEAKQAALNEQLSELDPDDPTRFFLISNAYQSVGDTESAVANLRIGSQLEEIERQKQAAAQQAQKEIDAKNAFLQYSQTKSDEDKANAIALGVPVANINALETRSKKDRYIAFGNNLFDTETEKFVTLPEAKKDAKDSYTSVTIGKNKFGILNKNTGEVEPINATTKEDAEQQAQDTRNLLLKLGAVDTKFSQIKDARDLVEEGAAGFEYGVAKLAPFTDAARLDALLQSLLSEQAFGRLQQMRDESKTGGALGQVSNIELDLLKAALTSLTPSLGAKEFNKQLDIVEKHYENVRRSLLGEMPEIDWNSPAYKDRVVSDEGKKYFYAPDGEYYLIGEE